MRRALILGTLIGAVGLSGTILALRSDNRSAAQLPARWQGPAEVLRAFAGAVGRKDCLDSYDLLAQSYQEVVNEETWCGEMIPFVAEGIAGDFTVRRVNFERGGGIADVHIGGTSVERWFLVREDEEWRLLSPRQPENAP